MYCNSPTAQGLYVWTTFAASKKFLVALGELEVFSVYSLSLIMNN